MYNLKPNKNAKVPVYDILTEGYDPDKIPTKNLNTPFDNPDKICNTCGWTNVGLLNLGNSNKTEHWMCHGCIERLYDNYYQLIMAVARKFPNETRHETALRYINERESMYNFPDCANDTIPPLPYRKFQERPIEMQKSEIP